MPVPGRPEAVNVSTGQVFYTDQVAAVKPANQTVNNSATLVDAAGLSATVSANRTYKMELVLLYDTGATPDMKVGLVVPSGTTGAWGPAAAKNAADANTSFVHAALSATMSPGGVSAGVLHIATYTGIVAVGSTGGTFKVQFAQDTANASDTILRANSLLLLRELPV